MADPIDGYTFAGNLKTALTSSPVAIPYPPTTKNLLVFDLSNTPPTVEQRECPALWPMGTFQTNYAEARQSCGLNGTAVYSANWQAKYAFAYIPVAAARVVQTDETDANVSQGVQAVVNAIRDLTQSLGVNDLTVSASESVRVFQGPAGGKVFYYGALITISVFDYANL